MATELISVEKSTYEKLIRMKGCLERKSGENRSINDVIEFLLKNSWVFQVAEANNQIA